MYDDFAVTLSNTFNASHYMLTRFLLNVRNEKDVENHYRSELMNEFVRHKDIITSTINISSPFKCDGLLECLTTDYTSLKILLEFKKNLRLTEKLHQSNVIAQMIYYLKSFQESSEEPIPDCIFIGDIDECFILPTHHLVLKYLPLDIDWTIAPSQVSTKNIELINLLLRDRAIEPVVFKVNESFKLRKIVDIAIGIVKRKYIEIHRLNLYEVFNFFFSQVVLQKKLKAKTKIDIFLNLLLDSEDIYIHPKKSNILVIDTYGMVEVNSNLCEYLMQNIFTEMELSTIATELENYCEQAKSTKSKSSKVESEKINHTQDLKLGQALAEAETNIDMENFFWESIYSEHVANKSIVEFLEFLSIWKSIRIYMFVDFADYEQCLLHLQFSAKPTPTKQLLFKNALTPVLSELRNSYTYDGVVRKQRNTVIFSKEAAYMLTHSALLNIFNQTEKSIENTNSYKAYLNRLCEGIDTSEIVIIPINDFSATGFIKTYFSQIIQIYANSMDLNVIFSPVRGSRRKTCYEYFCQFFSEFFIYPEDADFFLQNQYLMAEVLLSILTKGANSEYIKSAEGSYFLCRNNIKYQLKSHLLEQLFKTPKNIGNSSVNDNEALEQIADMALSIRE